MKCILKVPLAIAKAPLRIDAVHPLVHLSICLSPKSAHKNAIFSKTKQFRAMISIDGSIGSPRPTWAFQRTHYWTPKIQDGGNQLS